MKRCGRTPARRRSFNERPAAWPPHPWNYFPSRRNLSFSARLLGGPPDIFGPGPFVALPHLELNGLAFVKTIEIQAPKSASVEEYFLPFRCFDEPEPSISNNPLDGSLHHAPRLNQGRVPAAPALAGQRGDRSMRGDCTSSMGCLSKIKRRAWHGFPGHECTTGSPTRRVTVLRPRSRWLGAAVGETGSRRGWSANR